MIQLITDENTVEPESDMTRSAAPRLALTFPGYAEEQAVDSSFAVARPSKAPNLPCEAPTSLAVARPAKSLNSCGYLSLGFGGASAAGDVYMQIPTPAALEPHQPASIVCVDGQILNTLLQVYQLEQHDPH